MKQIVLVCHWNPDPDIWVQQVYGVFPTKKAAKEWARQHLDKSWHSEAFYVFQPDSEAKA